jgi:acyl-CoA thioesterase YciA
MSQTPIPREGEPKGALAIRTLAMPADTNANGDIFGGWLLGQMDIAGAVVAIRRAEGRVATVAVDAMSFHLPVLVGDLVSCYGEILRVGRTSIRVKVEAWVVRNREGRREKVTEGVFTYVAIGADGKPRAVPPGQSGILV